MEIFFQYQTSNFFLAKIDSRRRFFIFLSFQLALFLKPLAPAALLSCLIIASTVLRTPLFARKIWKTFLLALPLLLMTLAPSLIFFKGTSEFLQTLTLTLRILLSLFLVQCFLTLTSLSQISKILLWLGSGRVLFTLSFVFFFSLSFISRIFMHVDRILVSTQARNLSRFRVLRFTRILGTALINSLMKDVILIEESLILRNYPAQKVSYGFTSLWSKTSENLLCLVASIAAFLPSIVWIFT